MIFFLETDICCTPMWDILVGAEISVRNFWQSLTKMKKNDFSWIEILGRNFCPMTEISAQNRSLDIMSKQNIYSKSQQAIIRWKVMKFWIFFKNCLFRQKCWLLPKRQFLKKNSKFHNFSANYSLLRFWIYVLTQYQNFDFPQKFLSWCRNFCMKSVWMKSHFFSIFSKFW